MVQSIHHPAARLLPAVAGAALLLALTGCTSLPSLGYYPKKLDNTELHAEVFTESYRRLSIYSLEPVELNALVPKGLVALQEIDPSFKPVIDDSVLGTEDWRGWGPVTYQLINSSAKLRGTPPEDIYELFYPALLQGVDDYSHYIPPKEAETMDEYRNGYGGIGATFERRGSSFFIMDVFIDSPAAQAGLKAGDDVVAVNGQSANLLSIQDFIGQVRGKIGTNVVLSMRDGRQVSITRATVIPTTVALEMKSDVAIIRISRFMPGTANEFRTAAKQALYNKARAIVIDLHHNPGGLLESAIDIAGLLLPEGPLSRTEGRHPDAGSSYLNYDGDMLNGLPLYLVVDGYSASASEVLAAALQDNGRAVLVGAATYGKGVVQNVGPLPNGGEFAVTWSRLLSPHGRSWDKTGLQPDVCVIAAAKPCPKATDVESKAMAEALRLATH